MRSHTAKKQVSGRNEETGGGQRRGGHVCARGGGSTGAKGCPRIADRMKGKRRGKGSAMMRVRGGGWCPQSYSFLSKKRKKGRLSSPLFLSLTSSTALLSGVLGVAAAVTAVIAYEPKGPLTVFLRGGGSYDGGAVSDLLQQ